MEKDFSRFFETVNASVFFEKCNAYFGVSGNVTLNKSFYVFGLKLENRHYIMNKEYFDFQLPCANVLRDQWDVDTFDLVYSGADDTGFYDFGDIPDWEYPLRRGIDLKRPLWGTYFNMGRTQGMLNSNQITPER